MKESTLPNKILTPRPYLSWSQMNLFERDPAAYVAQYLYGQEGYTSDAAAFGKQIARKLEAKSSDDNEVERLRTLLPKFPKQEYEIRATFEGVPLLAKLDLFSPWRMQIGELKTGRYPWTQSRVNEHGQLKFYALAAWLKYKRVPRIELYWAPTEWQENKLRLSGEIQTFQTEFSPSDLLNFGARLPQVWTAIQQVTGEHYAKLREAEAKLIS
jgi:hypothetical protein